MKKECMQFCVECRSERTYGMRRIPYKKSIREKEYVFEITEAFCEVCGEPVSVPGLMDRNAAEIDRQYREIEGIASIEEIDNLMDVYNLGKTPLSYALGFGEITITRYLAGHVPSKAYSAIIKKALESPEFMTEKLQENKDKVGDAAYKKATDAIKKLKPLFALSEKMLLTISYIFNRVQEVTPLALQKMLYYVQGVHMVLNGKVLFYEDCEAWAHGPVFREVYDVFKNFKYNPIDDIRFAMFQNRFRELSDTERRVIDLVVETFGIYSGKTLERITHGETPWKEARGNCLPGDHSDEVISKESIQRYFEEVAREYEIGSVKGIREYIQSKLGYV